MFGLALLSITWCKLSRLVPTFKVMCLILLFIVSFHSMFISCRLAGLYVSGVVPSCLVYPCVPFVLRTLSLAYVTSVGKYKILNTMHSVYCSLKKYGFFQESYHCASYAGGQKAVKRVWSYKILRG